MSVHYYFVYRRHHGQQVDSRCPIGGVLVSGATRLMASLAAYDKATARFVCRSGELLHLIEVDDPTDVHHVQLLEADWERMYSTFHKMMTVN